MQDAGTAAGDAGDALLVLYDTALPIRRAFRQAYEAEEAGDD